MGKNEEVQGLGLLRGREDAVGTRARARGTGAKGLGRSVNKVDLVDVVYRTHGGISRQEASELVDTILGHVKSSLAKERRVRNVRIVQPRYRARW